MRSPFVGCDLIRIKLTSSTWRVLQENWFTPIRRKFAGSFGHDVTAAPELAMICTVLSADSIPKSKILRIKRTLGNNWFLGRFFPDNAVGRN